MTKAELCELSRRFSAYAMAIHPMFSLFVLAHQGFAETVGALPQAEFPGENPHRPLTTSAAPPETGQLTTG